LKLLACDIGNSFTKFISFDGDKIKCKYSLSNSEIDSLRIERFEFDSVAISSVVPEITKVLSNFLIKKNITPFIITKNAKLNFTIDYDTPETLGIDRICGTAGAISLIESSVISFNRKILFADLGTATTINFIEENILKGGIIAPGMRTMLEALNNKTAQLPLVNLGDYSGIIGKSTQSAITSGIINSSTGLLEKVYHSVYSDAEKQPIILTGGNAEFILEYLNIPYLFVENLVPTGIKKIAELNQ